MATPHFTTVIMVSNLISLSTLSHTIDITREFALVCVDFVSPTDPSGFERKARIYLQLLTRLLPFRLLLLDLQELSKARHSEDRMVQREKELEL